MKKKISNAEKYPEAWKIFVDCVRKWKEYNRIDYPEGWKYGIPNPIDCNEYLYSNCPGKLFLKFNNLYYQQSKMGKFRKFLDWLEMMEGKKSSKEYQFRINQRLV